MTRPADCAWITGKPEIIRCPEVRFWEVTPNFLEHRLRTFRSNCDGCGIKNLLPDLADKSERISDTLLKAIPVFRFYNIPGKQL